MEKIETNFHIASDSFSFFLYNFFSHELYEKVRIIFDLEDKLSRIQLSQNDANLRLKAALDDNVTHNFIFLFICLFFKKEIQFDAWGDGTV